CARLAPLAPVFNITGLRYSHWSFHQPSLADVDSATNNNATVASVLRAMIRGDPEVAVNDICIGAACNSCVTYHCVFSARHFASPSAHCSSPYPSRKPSSQPSAAWDADWVKLFCASLFCDAASATPCAALAAELPTPARSADRVTVPTGAPMKLPTSTL